MNKQFLEILKTDTQNSLEDANWPRRKATWLSEEVGKVVGATTIETVVPMLGRPRGIRMDVVSEDELFMIKSPQRSFDKNFNNIDDVVFSQLIRVAKANPRKRIFSVWLVNKIIPVFNGDNTIKRYDSAAEKILNNGSFDIAKMIVPNIEEIIVVGNNTEENLIPTSVSIHWR